MFENPQQASRDESKGKNARENAGARESAPERERGFMRKVRAFFGDRGREADAPADKLEFRYEDKDGRFVGLLSIELDPEEVDAAEKTLDGDVGRARKARSILMRGVKDGHPTEIDILELANPHGTDVLIATAPLRNYYHELETNRAVVPPQGHPFGLAVLLHELGHADQKRDERLGRVNPLYSKTLESASPKSREAFSPPLFDDVRTAIPEVENLVDEESLEEFEEMQGKMHEARAELEMVDEKAALVSETLQDTRERLRMRVGDKLADLDEQEREVSEAHAKLAEDDPAARAMVARLRDAFERAGFDFGDTRDAYLSLDKLHRALEGVEDGRSAVIKYSEAEGVLEIRYRVTHNEERIRVRVPFTKEEYAEYRTTAEPAKRERLILKRERLALRERIKTLEDEMRAVARASGLEDVVKIPYKLLERDATCRAFRWMRQIRERAGIDLFSSFAIPAHGRREGLVRDSKGGCVGSLRSALEQGARDESAGDVRKLLKGFLRTYGAESSWRKRSKST